MIRIPKALFLALPLCLLLAGCFAGQKKQLAACEADATRKRRAAVVDQMAAAYLLQAALDATRPA
jgi:putative Holliday junction resolvase